MPKPLRMPPRVKVLEALGAIADNRIKRVDDKVYEVTSSDGTRRYKVVVDLDGRRVYSDDNGTRFRRYIGYPIIAVLMLNNILPFDERLSKALKGVPWRKLNETYKKYAIVEKIVKGLAEKNGVKPYEIDLFVENVLRRLRSLHLYYEEKLA